jgi:hydrogenase maturation protease
MTKSTSPILIATCGNADAGDDAFGPAVGRAVAAMNFPGVTSGGPGVEVVDLGIRPAALLDYLEGREALVVVDAVKVPGQAGGLIDVDWFDANRPTLAHDDRMSSHGLSMGSQLELAGQLGMLPKMVRLIGVGIESSELGRPMSPNVGAQVDMAAKRIAGHCRAWLQR